MKRILFALIIGLAVVLGTWGIFHASKVREFRKHQLQTSVAHEKIGPPHCIPGIPGFPGNCP